MKNIELELSLSEIMLITKCLQEYNATACENHSLYDMIKVCEIMSKIESKINPIYEKIRVCETKRQEDFEK